MIKINDIINAIEDFAPLSLQESYDNTGLQVGNREVEAMSVLLCLDVTEAIVDEAVRRGANLIVTHHPLLFRGLKHITGNTSIERIVSKAIKNDIAIYSAHTNMDNAEGGVSYRMAAKLDLKNVTVLQPQKGKLLKLVTFVPTAHVECVQQALWSAGAGRMGNYDKCSNQMEGNGTFRVLDGANPYVGEPGEHHVEQEVRVEVLLPEWRKSAVVKALLDVHPYEEPAFDLLALENEAKSGSGVVGDIEGGEDAMTFLSRLKKTFNVGAVAYSGTVEGKTINRVALCGGSGAEFVRDAISAKADIYVTGDVKYHDYTSNNESIIMANIGHYESEECTKELFYDIIQKKFPNFATYYAEIEKNPINYL